MTTISDPLRLVLCPGDTPAGRTLAPRDAAGLRARGHQVRLASSDELHPAATPADVILAYTLEDVVTLAGAGLGPVLHMNADPTTARAAGESPRAIDAAQAATSFHAAPSPGAQREILLGHGGRCWLVPPGVPPALAPASRAHVTGAPLRVGILEPYPREIPWIAAIRRDHPANAPYEIQQVPFTEWSSCLADLDVAVLPSVGSSDGTAWLATEIVARGLPLLVADAEPFHALLPAGTETSCVFPVGSARALHERLGALAADEECMSRLDAAVRSIRASHPLARRIDALERALAEITRHTRTSAAAGRPTAVWLPRGHGSATESRYTFAAQLARERRVLDVACGDGRQSVRLADAGARVVVGIDTRPENVALAQRLRAREGTVTFACMSPENLDLPTGNVDLVLALDTMEEITDPRAFAEEAARVLTPNGTLLIALDNARPAAHDDPALRDEASPLVPLRDLLGDVFGHVAVFAERAGSWGITVRGGTPDPDRDTGWILLATRPARLPSDSTFEETRTRARAGDRHMA